MYMLNDLAIEMYRAQSAERHVAARAARNPAERTRRVRRGAWWRRHGHLHRSAGPAPQQRVTAVAMTRPSTEG